MKWIEPKYSKTKVRQAGLSLIDKGSSAEKITDALDILSNWRAIHAYPMHSILIFLRGKAKKIDRNSFVVQRLKRTPSIIAKLKREKSMKLDRMQDIGGCRAVVGNVKQAITLSNSIVNSRTVHTFHGKKDYIAEPKSSGYRGIHLIYKYNGSKKTYENLFIEIQVRSRIQHSWATAVEVVDTFTGQALKASKGMDEWLLFFRYVSFEFARLESSPMDISLIDTDVLGEINRLYIKLKVEEKLRAFAVSTKTLGRHDHTKSDFYLLSLDTKERKVKVNRFKRSEIAEATGKYLELEKEFVNHKEKEVVLITAASVNNLKTAYPNYFADTESFISNLNKVMKDNN